MEKLAQIKKELEGYKKRLAEKDAECEEDESVQDDTEWVNDYHNLTGWVEALEYVVNLLEENTAKKKKKK